MKDRWQNYKNSAEKAQSEGKYEYAENLWYAALEESKEFGPTDRRRALSLERLCECLWFQEKFKDAEPMAQELVVIYTKVFGQEHVDVAGMQANLGLLYVVMQKEELAEPILLKALSIKKRILGLSHPDVQKLQVTYDDVLQKLKNKGSAPALVTARQWSKTGRFEALKPPVAPPAPQKVLTADEAMALWEPLYQAGVEALSLGDWAKAEERLNKGLDIAQSFGEGDHRLCLTLEGLAKALGSQDRNQQAAPLLERVHQAKVRVFGPNHSVVAESADSLARCYYYCGNYGAAEKSALESCAIYEKMYGPEHLSVASCLGNIAMLYFVHKKMVEAETAYKRCLAIRTKVQGAGHTDTVKVLQNYANLLRQTHREDEANHLQACATGFVTGSWKVIEIAREDSLDPAADNCEVCATPLDGYYKCGKCGADVLARGKQVNER
jgi:tetratricopeptide (TPR) repeat protein